jgi:hypothetical protein
VVFQKSRHWRTEALSRRIVGLVTHLLGLPGFLPATRSSHSVVNSVEHTRYLPETDPPNPSQELQLVGLTAEKQKY